MSDDRIAALEAEVAELRGRVDAWLDGLDRVFVAAGYPVPDSLRQYRRAGLHIIKGER